MRATSFWQERALLAKPRIRYRAEKIFRKQGSLFQIARMAASFKTSFYDIPVPETVSIKQRPPNVA